MATCERCGGYESDEHSECCSQCGGEYCMDCMHGYHCLDCAEDDALDDDDYIDFADEDFDYDE